MTTCSLYNCLKYHLAWTFLLPICLIRQLNQLRSFTVHCIQQYIFIFNGHIIYLRIFISIGTWFQLVFCFAFKLHQNSIKFPKIDTNTFRQIILIPTDHGIILPSHNQWAWRAYTQQIKLIISIFWFGKMITIYSC